MLNKTGKVFEQLAERKQYKQKITDHMSQRGFFIDDLSFEKKVLSVSVQSNRLDVCSARVTRLTTALEQTLKGKWLKIHTDNDILVKIDFKMKRNPPGW